MARLLRIAGLPHNDLPPLEQPGLEAAADHLRQGRSRNSGKIDGEIDQKGLARYGTVRREGRRERFDDPAIVDDTCAIAPSSTANRIDVNRRSEGSEPVHGHAQNPCGIRRAGLGGDRMHFARRLCHGFDKCIVVEIAQRALQSDVQNHRARACVDQAAQGMGINATGPRLAASMSHCRGVRLDEHDVAAGRARRDRKSHVVKGGIERGKPAHGHRHKHRCAHYRRDNEMLNPRHR